MEMDKLQVLKKLVDDEAISFIIANEQELNKLYYVYLNTFKESYVTGIDLANSKDYTAYTTPFKIAYINI